MARKQSFAVQLLHSRSSPAIRSIKALISMKEQRYRQSKRDASSYRKWGCSCLQRTIWVCIILCYVFFQQIFTPWYILIERHTHSEQKQIYFKRPLLTSQKSRSFLTITTTLMYLFCIPRKALVTNYSLFSLNHYLWHLFTSPVYVYFPESSRNAKTCYFEVKFNKMRISA